MYDQEEIEEEKVRAFAKEIDAIFRLTSAKNASGVDELFKVIGNKFIDPNSSADEMTPEEKEIEKVRRQTVKISTNDDKKNEPSKGKCC